MADLIGAVTKATGSFLEINQISIDNWGFKLFYKATTSILIACSVLVTMTQFFGSPIQCDAGSASGGVEKDVLESYCWMYSTWSIPTKYKGVCSAHGDLSGITVTEWNKERTSIVYNSYYQWVPLYLVTLAVVFYLPRLLWLMLEGGLMKFFGKGTTTRVIEDQEEKEEALVKFFCQNVHNKYSIYFFGFIGCEVFNVFLVLIQFVFTNIFLHNRFSFYGPQVLFYYRLPEEEQALQKNPMCWTFPRLASCNYWRWGPGGMQENINAICVLALNMINDKVFLVLWWWFFLVSVIGILRLVYRFIQTQSSKLRFQLINMRMNRYFKRPTTKMCKIESYLCQCSLGDWFVLYQLSKNLNRPFFFDFLVHLSQRYDKEYPDEEDDTRPLMSQMESRLKPCKTKILDEVDKKVLSKAPLCPEEDCCGFSSKDFDDGDNLIEMLTQPKIRDETDGKKKDDKDDDDDDDDDEDDDKDDKDDKKEKKKEKGEDGGGRRRIGGGGGDDDEDIRLDIPDGSSYSPKSSKREASNGGKATQSVSRPKGSSKGGRRH